MTTDFLHDMPIPPSSPSARTLDVSWLFYDPTNHGVPQQANSQSWLLEDNTSDVTGVRPTLDQLTHG